MATPPEMAIPMSPEGLARYERERQRDRDVIKAAVEIADARIRGELQAEAEMATEAAAATERMRHQPKSNKGVGDVTRIAIRAGTAVLHDTIGAPEFPKTGAEMARAIAAMASQLGLVPPDAPLNPDSRPVRDVAEDFVLGAALARAREEQNQKPPEPAGNRRHGPLRTG